MITRAEPLVDDVDRFFAAYLIAERLQEILRQRAELRARPRDGQWSHFIDSKAGIRSQLEDER